VIGVFDFWRRWNENLAAVQKAWGRVSNLHPQIRNFQNYMAYRAIGEKVDLKPAEISFDKLQYLLRGQYLICRSGATDVIVIPRSYVNDFEKKRIKHSNLTLDDFVLNQVASAEGVRTANYCTIQYGWIGGFFGHEEPAAMMAVGDYLREISVKRVGRQTWSAGAGRNILVESKGLASFLKNPLYAYDLVLEGGVVNA
jgi:hypothetical protein